MPFDMFEGNDFREENAGHVFMDVCTLCGRMSGWDIPTEYVCV